MFGIDFIKKSCIKLFENKSLFEIKKFPKYLNDKLLNALKKEYNNRILHNQDTWELTARENQKLPDGNWFIWLILAGRGFGKTRAGAEAVKQLVLSGKYKRIALIGETFDQIRSVMLEGESGLLNLKYPNNNQPTYYPSKKKLIWKDNGAIATFYSAEDPEQLRGPQFDLAWIDEFAKFQNDQKIWDQLMFCLRFGNPKVIITTTPKPKDIIFKLIKRNDIHLTKGSTFDNKKNLSFSFLTNIQNEYSHTKFGNQEINGELLDKDEAQLWSHQNFIYEEISQTLIDQMYIIIAIDPAMTAKETSDETGIIVAGYLNDKFYVLEDASAKMTCTLWIKKTCELFHKYKAKKIFVETNQGGDVLINMLESFEKLPWTGIRAKIDKYSRAIPIAALYEQKKVIHAKHFQLLEEQLLKSHLNFLDDRLDALTWALSQLNQPPIIDNSQNIFGFF